MKPDPVCRGDGRRGVPAALALLAALAVLAGCKPVEPPVEETLPRATLVERYNARAETIKSLWSRCHVEARVPKFDRQGRPIKGRYEAWPADGNFILRKPRDLFLEGRFFSDPVFGLHSNSEMYWFWVKPEASVEYHGRHDGPGAKRFPLRPDYLLDTLGVFPVTTDLSAFRRGDQYDVIQVMDVDVARPAPNKHPEQVAVRLSVRQEIFLERVHHDPMEVRLYDGEGEVLVVSRLEDYREVEGVRVPTRLVYRFVPADATFTLTLKDISLSKPLKDAAFARRPAPVAHTRDLDAEAESGLPAPPAAGLK